MVQMVRGFARFKSVSIAGKRMARSAGESEVIAVPERLSAESELVLDRELELEYKGCKQKTYVADLLISFKDSIEPTLVILASVDRAYKNDEDVVQKFDFSVGLHLYLPKSEFHNFMERLKLGFAASVYFDLLNPLQTSEEELLVTAGIVDLNIVYCVGISNTPDWYADSLELQAKKLLEPLALTTKTRSQINRIISDFSTSAASANRVLRADGKDIKTIKEILANLRYELLSRVPDPSDQSTYSNLWFSQPNEFLEKIYQFDDGKRNVLIEQYDNIWRNVNINNVIAVGEDDTGAFNFDPQQDELGGVATQLLELYPMRSLTLEKILVNALIYAETVQFARLVLSKEKRFGMRVPLKVLKREQSDLKKFGKSLWELFFEILKIGLTIGASFVITNENVIAAWIVATGITLFRWWHSTFTVGQKDNVKEHKLLQEMCAVHQLSNNPNYNPRLLRNRLYEVSSQGAIFSPLIFSILDMQIREADSQS